MARKRVEYYYPDRHTIININNFQERAVRAHLNSLLERQLDENWKPFDHCKLQVYLYEKNGVGTHWPNWRRICDQRRCICGKGLSNRDILSESIILN